MTETGWTWKPNPRSYQGEERKGGKFYPDARMGEWSLELAEGIELRIIGRTRGRYAVKRPVSAPVSPVRRLRVEQLRLSL